GGGRTFIAGADIKEFGKITSGQKRELSGLMPLLAALENSPKPVVAAIHGTAFGGGLETAMACHYRVAVPAAQVGQPEVKLGLIPGAGGTQRLPRLAGAVKAAEMCAGGEPIRAADALAWGVLDKLIDGDLLAGAVAFARDDPPGAGRRRRHDGRRHRHGLRQRRHPRATQGGRSGRPRPRAGDDPEELRGHRAEGASDPTADGRAAGTHRADAELRPVRR